MARTQIFRFIDLFSGAGGLAQGFRQASDEGVEFRSVYAVECDTSAACSYAANFGHVVFSQKIERLKLDQLPAAEIIVGGPPCQGFSPLGKMSPSKHHPGMNKLWRYFFRAVERVRPVAFVVENVPEFLRSQEYVEAELVAKKLGYDVASGVLNAADFGVPQRRRRGFLVGTRRGRAALPEPPILEHVRCVRDAIWNLRAEPIVYELPEPVPSKCAHGARLVSQLHLGRNPTRKSLERYACVPPGGNRFDLVRRRPDLAPLCWIRKASGSTDVFGRLEWDKPALTIRTEFFKPEKGCYLHPEFPRPITHWEAARLQTFPDTYLFCGSKIEIARQIGNAVPPKLAQAVANKLKEIISARRNSVRRAVSERVATAIQIPLY